VLVRPGMVQRMPLLIISSHTSSLGEQSYSHSESRLVIEPIIRALGIPYTILMRMEDAKMLIKEAQVMVEGQTFPAAVLIPRHIYFKKATD
jgi:sulfopyruvate decarboxylase TPP-binding subunit